MSKHQPHDRGQMAELLRCSVDTILADWERAVRESVPGDQTLERSLLRDSLPHLLKNLANALEDEKWTYHAGKNAEIALDHARQRFRVGVHQFAEVVDEYAELRRAVVANVAGRAYSTAAGVRVIHEFIDASIKHAGGLFAELRHQADKKCLNEEKESLSDRLQHTEIQRDGFEDERDLSRSYATDLEEERRLRSEVVAMLGHDMRTPLSAALLAAQQLARAPEAIAKTPQRLDRVVRAIERLNAMLENMLDADKLRTGQPCAIAVASCDIADTVGNAYQALVESYGNRFVADIPGRLIGYWDRAALGRVIENLANNAIKYGSGTASISLKLRKSGHQVELSVHNEGDPIAPHELGRLFEPHFRTDAAGRSEKSGWGLGLASVKAIAEAHGGSVDVDSAPGRGTTFCVRLPLDSRSAQQAKKN